MNAVFWGCAECTACENVGIKTVFVTGEEDPSTNGPPLLEPLPEARAIVSTGMGIEAGSGGPLPPVDRVIGQKLLMADTSQRQNLVPSDGPLPGIRWTDHYGFSKISAFEY